MPKTTKSMSKILSRKGKITLEKVSSTEYWVVEPDIHGNKRVQVVSNFCAAVKTFLNPKAKKPYDIVRSRIYLADGFEMSREEFNEKADEFAKLLIKAFNNNINFLLNELTEFRDYTTGFHKLTYLRNNNNN